VRHKVSAAWLELGYCGSLRSAEELNVEAETARRRDRQEHAQRKAERESVPVRRVVARSLFAQMHAVIDAEGEA
jgi:hypothetical protein